jgi:beta-N-acetylhexosaminidase
MIDLGGTSLAPEEKEMLLNPLVGGIILFTRNYESIEQIVSLIRDIHALREPRLLIAVDHEGGSVQRFREGFTRLPAAASLGKIYRENRKKARSLALKCGWLMGAELRAIRVDFSFAPVLDLAHGFSGVIGDRAFHRSPEAVADLARYVMSGMRRAGMQAVGKHFPGHGGVREDSHVALPVDRRPLADILSEDVVSFERMIHYGLAGIMPAHVIYSDVDSRPAGYSPYWLNNVLREQLGFQGAIFSDDLSMQAAHVVGGFAERAEAALNAGCDMALICNDSQGVEQVFRSMAGYENAVSQIRLARFHGRKAVSYAQLHKSDTWKRAVSEIMPLIEDSHSLELNL